MLNIEMVSISLCVYLCKFHNLFDYISSKMADNEKTLGIDDDYFGDDYLFFPGEELLDEKFGNDIEETIDKVSKRRQHLLFQVYFNRDFLLININI